MKNKSVLLGHYLPLLTLIIFLLSCHFINAQITGNSWAINEGTINWDEVTGVKTDNIGNYVIAGSFYDSIRLGSVTVHGAGSGDIYSATYNKYGSLQSVRSFGSSGTEYLNYFAIDNQNNNILAGVYYSPPTFFDTYLFFGKYNESGALLWQQPIRNSFVYINSLDVDGQNSVLGAGSFSDTATIGGFHVTASGLQDVFFVKFSSDGVPQWIKTLGLPAHSFYNSKVHAAQNNDIIFAGSYSYNDEITSYSKFFYAKYDLSGTLLWLKEATSPGNANIRSISSDLENNILISGYFDSTLTIDNLNYESLGNTLFLAKLSPEGNLIWFRNMSYGEGNEITSLTTDVSGSIYGIGNTYIQSELSRMFINKYSTDGNLLWDMTYLDIESSGRGLISDPEGDVVFTGTFYDSITLAGRNLISRGGNDIFLYKMTAPRLDTSPGFIDFGITSPGLAVTDTIFIFNPSEQPVTIKYHYVTGLNPSEFFILSGAEEKVLPPLNVYPLIVSFNPMSAGLKEAEITAVTDAVTGPISISLSGSGDVPRFVTSSSLLDFGSVEILNEIIKTITVYNDSYMNLNIINTGISGNTTNDFTLVNNVSSIPPHDSGFFQIRFRPNSQGVKTGMFVVQSNAEGSPHGIELSGEGVQSSPVYRDTIDFETCNIPDTLLIEFSVFNQGTTDLYIDMISIAGTDYSDFYFQAPYPYPPVPPSGTFDFPLFFKPTSPGSKSAVLVIYSNSPFSPDSIFLKGRGVLPLQISLNSTEGISVDVIPPTGYNFSQNFLFHKRTGEQQFTPEEFTFMGEEYTAYFPSDYLTIRGIQYYVSFSDGETTITYPDENPEINPAYIQADYISYVFPFQLLPRTYRMITIPLVSADLSLKNTLLGNFGTPDAKQWRLLEWNAADSIYQEFPDLSDTIIAGKAYWLISSEAKNFAMQNVRALYPFAPFELKLNPGWNQIGNPFVFRTAWPETSPYVSLPILWDASASSYVYEQTRLEPWLGYWVYNEASDIISISIFPEEMDSVINEIAKEQNEFLLKLKLFSGNALQDEIIIGTKNNPQKKHSIYKPPLLNKEFSSAILEDSKEYAKKIKKTSTEGEYWDFTISSDNSQKQIYLKIEYLNPIPEEFDIWILDLNRNISLPVYKDLVNLSTSGEKGLFRIITGTKEFALKNSGTISLIPADVTLYQNYPNPFNPSTIIAYSIPDRGMVKITLYDALGREIRQLVNEEQGSGTHEALVNMEDCASGIYFYTLQFRDNRLTKKLTFIK
jgi:hypothetical protein